MVTNTRRLDPVIRGWRWLLKMGLAIPLIAGAAVALLAVITWVSPRYEAPHEVAVGVPADYEFGSPVYFEHDRFWVSKLPSGELVALYDRDPITGCTVPWDPNYEALGVTGWFRDACSRSIYDLSGGCFQGPCGIGLNRLDIRVEDGMTLVDQRSGTAGVPKTENGDPIDPSQ